MRRGRAAAALKALIRDARDCAAAGREILIFPEGTCCYGAAPDYKPGVVALYEGLGLPCVPVALNSGLFWPRSLAAAPAGDDRGAHSRPAAGPATCGIQAAAAREDRKRVRALRGRSHQRQK